MRREVVRLAATLALLLLAVACGDDKVQAVVPSIRVIPTHQTADGQMLVDYGPVPVLNRVEKQIVIRNEGRAPLRIDGIEIESPVEGVFIPDDEKSRDPILPGTEIQVGVTFRPPEEAEFHATLTIFHNDEKQDPVVVLLDGVGSTVGRVEVDPKSIDFGRVGERTQAVQTFRIQSVGTAQLIVESLELVDAGPEFFFLGSTTTPANLPPPSGGLPGGEVAIQVACSPTEDSPDSLSGTVLITTTDPDKREIRIPLTATVNRAPIAEIGPTSGVPAPGDPVQLDGSTSHDVDGDEPIEFLWRVVQKPLGSEASIDDPTAPAPRLLTDVPGHYRVGLDVADSTGLSCLHVDDNPNVPCAFIDLEVRSADDIVVQLVWDHERTDLDLHLMESGFPIESSKDCYYGNTNPDFGTMGDLTDDPRLVIDDLGGLGPEQIVFSKPPEGRFDVAVVFAKANGAEQPATRAILRLYVYGILEAEMVRTLDKADQVWNVLSFDWPSGAITATDTVQDPAPAP